MDDEDFVKYESLKSYVGEMSLTKSSKVHLADGDSVDIVHKSLGEAFEIRKSVKTDEPRIKESRDGEAVSNSFELISERFAIHSFIYSFNHLFIHSLIQLNG